MPSESPESNFLQGKKMKKDATFKWDDKDFVNFYTDSANFIVLERQRSIRILLEIVAFHFPSLSGLHILDLGCGEGIITKYICDKSPDNNFYLLDASEEMLNKARGNLTSSKSNISFSHRTFEDYSHPNRKTGSMTSCFPRMRFIILI